MKGTVTQHLIQLGAPVCLFSAVRVTGLKSMPRGECLRYELASGDARYPRPVLVFFCLSRAAGNSYLAGFGLKKR